jgi:hypothetical protein
MPKIRRLELAAEAHRRNLEQLARLGGEVCVARHRRGMTEQQVANLAGVSRSAESASGGDVAATQLLTWRRA